MGAGWVPPAAVFAAFVTEQARASWGDADMPSVGADGGGEASGYRSGGAAQGRDGRHAGRAGPLPAAASGGLNGTEAGPWGPASGGLVGVSDRLWCRWCDMRLQSLLLERHD